MYVVFYICSDTLTFGQQHNYPTCLLYFQYIGFMSVLLVAELTAVIYVALERTDVSI